jgi:hypothetical protein
MILPGGTQLGPYEILDSLGAGGMGAWGRLVGPGIEETSPRRSDCPTHLCPHAPKLSIAQYPSLPGNISPLAAHKTTKHHWCQTISKIVIFIIYRLNYYLTGLINKTSFIRDSNRQ